MKIAFLDSPLKFGCASASRSVTNAGQETVDLTHIQEVRLVVKETA